MLEIWRIGGTSLSQTQTSSWRPSAKPRHLLGVPQPPADIFPASLRQSVSVRHLQTGHPPDIDWPRGEYLSKNLKLFAWLFGVSWNCLPSTTRNNLKTAYWIFNTKSGFLTFISWIDMIEINFYFSSFHKMFCIFEICWPHLSELVFARCLQRRPAKTGDAIEIDREHTIFCFQQLL